MDADPAASAEVMSHVGKRAVPQLVIDGEWFQPYTPGRGLLFDELHPAAREFLADKPLYLVQSECRESWIVIRVAGRILGR